MLDAASDGLRAGKKAKTSYGCSKSLKQIEREAAAAAKKSAELRKAKATQNLDLLKSKISANRNVEKSIKYTAFDKGPLKDDVANTFRSASYTQRNTNEVGMTLYRAYGGNAKQIGSYWTRQKPNGPLQAMIDSALDPNWGNTATHISKIQVPPGVTYYEGKAAAQRGLVGGGNQIYIERVDLKWLIP